MNSVELPVFLVWEINRESPVLRAIDTSRFIATCHKQFLETKYPERQFSIERRATNHVFAIGYLGRIRNKYDMTGDENTGVVI